MTSNKKKSLSSNKSLFWLLLFGLGIAGILFILYITPYGMGLVNDSVGYICGARNILDSNGYSRLTGNGSPVPVTNYPPLFSIVLAMVSFFGPEAIDAAWLVNTFLFGVNILLMGVVVCKATGSELFGLLGALFFAISEPLFGAHSYAMSEPLYLFLTFLTLLFLVTFLGKSRWVWLATSGLMAGFAFLARYVGVSLFATALLSLIVFINDWKKRLTNWMIFLASGIPPVLIWVVRNYFVSSNVGNRQFLLHPIDAEKMREGLMNFWSWLLPEAGGFVERLLPFWSLTFFVLIFIICVGTVVVAVNYQRGWFNLHKSSLKTTWIFALQTLMYLGTLIFTMTFVDASPIFEHRILSPFYVSLLVITMGFLSWLWERKTRLSRLITVLLAFALLVSFIEDGIDAAHMLHADGQGFAKSYWRESETIEEVDNLPDIQIYSNRTTAIYILADRPSYFLPSPTNPATQQPREGYEEDVTNIRAQVLEGEAFVVIFGNKTIEAESEESFAWMRDLIDGMPVFREFDDDIILGLLPQE